MMSVNNPGSRNRRPPGGGGGNNWVGGHHQPPYNMRPGAMLPLTNPTPQPTPAHMMQVSYNQQSQSQRRALLQGPPMPHHNTQRSNTAAAQMGAYTHQHMYSHPMLPPQPHAMAGLAHYGAFQPQQIYSTVPAAAHPPYPVSTVRAQHGSHRTKQPKKGSSAIAIIDPDTKTELDTSNLTKGGTSSAVTISNTTTTNATTTPVSTAITISTNDSSTNTTTVTDQSAIDENKRKAFKEQMHEITSSSTATSSEHRPNALISSPSTERHTVAPPNSTRSNIVKPPEGGGSLLPDPIVPLTRPQDIAKPIVPPVTDSSSKSVVNKPVVTTDMTAQTTADTKSSPADPKSLPTDPKSLPTDPKSLPSDAKTDTSAESILTDTDQCVNTNTKSVDTSDTKSSPPVDRSSTVEETIKQVVVSSVGVNNSSSERHPKAAGGLLPTPPLSSALTNVDPKILEEIMSNSSLSTSKIDSSSSSISSSQTTVSDNDRFIDKSATGGGGVGELSQEEFSDDVIQDMKEGDMLPNGHISSKDQDMFKDSQGRYIYKRDFLLQYSSLPLPPPSVLKEFDLLSYGAGARSVENMRKSPLQGLYPRPGKSLKVIDHHPSRAEKVELRKAENRWKRPEERTDAEDPETEKLFRKFQGILNKLTPQKFKDLAERARDLEINSEERLKGCIDKIFSKALEEPNFSVAYAHLCRVLSFIKVEVVKVDDSSGEETVKETTFRRELLTRCQKEFEKDKRDDEDREEKLKAIEEATTPEEKSLKEAELAEWENKTRKRQLGNIRFIGELFKLKMLSESIMHDCIVRLLRSTSDEDSLECFSRLITTTGKELDHPQAKVRLDRYFERINEIIEKKKISSRIRFMLQDVQEMRKNDWVPRKQETLKTIDQIHQEAEMEAIQEQEMLRAMQPVPGKQYAREGDRGKRGNKDDYGSGSGRKNDKGSTAVRRDSTPDVTRIVALGSKKEKTTPSLGPGSSLRPGGWKSSRNQGPSPPSTTPTGSTTPVESSKAPLKGPQRSSSSGTKRQNSSSGRNSQQGTKRSLTNPDEKTETLKMIKDFCSTPQVPAAVGPSPTLAKKPIKDKLDEETIERKTATIVDELTQNGDYKEAVECVIELESPGLIHVFVRAAINHSLEKSSSCRVTVGKLFDELIKEKQLTEDKLSQGLQEVLEFADELEVDIPKIWDFFAELMGPLVRGGSLSLSLWGRLLNDANLGRKAAKVTSRTLKDCLSFLGREKVFLLWEESDLKWTKLGLSEDEVEEFLKDEDISFLSQVQSSSPLGGGGPVHVVANDSISLPSNPPYLKDLTSLFGSQNSTTDEILDWIEEQINKEEAKAPDFVKTLARAAVAGSSSGGDGNSHIFNEENFNKRLTLLKKWVDQDEQLQELILEGVQVGVAILKHPPGLLHKMLHLLYDVEVVSEVALLKWYKSGKESFGRGVVLQSSKKFFNWLESAEAESDNETV